MDTPIILDLKSNQQLLDSIVDKHRYLDADDLLSLAAATAELNRAITLLAERTLVSAKSSEGRPVGW